MDVNRRNLMKGVLTGSTLLAMGIPPAAFASAPPAGKAAKFGLLLGNTRVDAAFAAGIRTAYAENAKSAAAESGLAGASANVGHGVPQVVKLKGGLLNDYEEVAGLLEKSRDTRWIAVMDDGSAAVFMELARNAGAKLLLLGSHASSGDDTFISHGIPELRHVWAAASPMHSAAAVLASQLIANRGSFSIVENFISTEHSFTEARDEGVVKNRFVPAGFSTYEFDGGREAIQLHCSGLSASDGCKSLGWNTAGRWTPIGGEALVRGTPTSARTGTAHLPFAGWVESVGYAVMAAALGTGFVHEPCSSRAFVHRSAMENEGERIGAAERFTSFVIDI